MGVSTNAVDDAVRDIRSSHCGGFSTLGRRSHGGCFSWSFYGWSHLDRYSFAAGSFHDHGLTTADRSRAANLGTFGRRRLFANGLGGAAGFGFRTFFWLFAAFRFAATKDLSQQSTFEDRRIGSLRCHAKGNA
jgi:hypothetical protein